MKRGSRRGLNRYYCKNCQRSFTVDHRPKDDVLWIPHVDGIPFRKLGDEHGLSGAQAYNRVFTELQQLPNVFQITKAYCQYTSGILIIDGKYIKVKGFKQKIPWIYAIDYITHDILFGMVAESEDIRAFETFFTILKQCNYPLQIVVADDRSSLPIGLKRVYADIPIQLCQNHYLEHIRQQLHIRTDATHQHFLMHSNNMYLLNMLIMNN